MAKTIKDMFIATDEETIKKFKEVLKKKYPSSSFKKVKNTDEPSFEFAAILDVEKYSEFLKTEKMIKNSILAEVNKW